MRKCDRNRGLSQCTGRDRGPGGTGVQRRLLTSHLGDALQTRDGQGHHEAQAGANHQQAVADEQAGHRQALGPWMERGKRRRSRQLRRAGGRHSVPRQETPPASSQSARCAKHALPGLSNHMLCSLPPQGKTRGQASVLGTLQKEPSCLPGDRGSTAPRMDVPARARQHNSATAGDLLKLLLERRTRPGPA